MVSITLDDTNIQHKSKDDKIQIASFTDPGSPQRNTCFHHFRYVVIVLGGFVMGWMLLFRFTISMAMISMINKTAIYIKEHPNSTIENYFPPEYVELGEFDWNNEIQQIIMTGYMIAYALPQFFTTRMSIKYGLRTSIPVSLSICSISTILTPYMSYWGWEWVLALRLLNGLGASAILPSMISAIEIWMPSGESAIGLALFQFVSGVINAMIPLISGFLTAHHWKWAFHVPGILGLVLCAIWWIVVADNPASSKYISQSEIDLINEIDYNIDEAAASGKKCGKVVQRSDLPWYFVFKIKSFYFLSLALILLDTTVNGFIFILPAYINRVLKVPVEDIGFLNFTVQIGAMFCMLWPTPMTQFLQKKFKMSLTAARNVITFICKFQRDFKLSIQSFAPVINLAHCTKISSNRCKHSGFYVRLPGSLS